MEKTSTQVKVHEAFDAITAETANLFRSLLCLEYDFHSGTFFELAAITDQLGRNVDAFARQVVAAGPVDRGAIKAIRTAAELIMHACDARCSGCGRHTANSCSSCDASCCPRCFPEHRQTRECRDSALWD